MAVAIFVPSFLFFHLIPDAKMASRAVFRPRASTSTTNGKGEIRQALRFPADMRPLTSEQQIPDPTRKGRDWVRDDTRRVLLVRVGVTGLKTPHYRSGSRRTRQVVPVRGTIPHL